MDQPARGYTGKIKVPDPQPRTDTETHRLAPSDLMKTDQVADAGAGAVAARMMPDRYQNHTCPAFMMNMGVGYKKHV